MLFLVRAHCSIINKIKKNSNLPKEMVTIIYPIEMIRA